MGRGKHGISRLGRRYSQMQGVRSSRRMQVDVIEMSGHNISSKFLKCGEEGMVTVTDNAMN